MNHKTISHNSINKLHHSRTSYLHHPKPGKLEHKQPDKTYYWVWAESDATGRQVIFGCKSTQEEAQSVVDKIHNAECRVTPLNTKDSAEAARRLRAIALMGNGDIDKSFRRFKHLEAKS